VTQRYNDLSYFAFFFFLTGSRFSLKGEELVVWMNAPGLLHNLSLEIPTDGNESWYAYSSHQVAATKPALDRRSASASGSATPSPQKQRKRSPPRLQNWTVRLCQIVKQGTGSSSKKDHQTHTTEAEDSLTESDEDLPLEPADVLTAWYSAQFNASLASTLTKESGESSWHTLELSIRVAWDKSCVDVMGSQEERYKDGTYPSIKVSVDVKGD